MQMPRLSSVAVLLTSVALAVVQVEAGCTTTSTATGLCTDCGSSGIATETSYLATVTQTVTENCHGCSAITIKPVVCFCPLITSVTTITEPTETLSHYVCSPTA